MKRNITILSIFLLITHIISHSDDDLVKSQKEIDDEINQSVITYGSALRIENVLSKYSLYSSNMQWGTGSQMQIITAISDRSDSNGVWIIKEKHNDIMKDTGEAVKCNDIVRLEHSNTSKNLHSHSFRSWITDSQEACGFGNNGNGDENDNFKIICYNYNENKLKGISQFFLQHVGTGAYLYINVKTSLYDERSCRNCPIMYHREVSLTTNKDKQSLWKIYGGLIFKEKVEEEMKYLEEDN